MKKLVKGLNLQYFPKSVRRLGGFDFGLKVKNIILDKEGKILIFNMFNIWKVSVSNSGAFFGDTVSGNNHAFTVVNGVKYRNWSILLSPHDIKEILNGNEKKYINRGLYSFGDDLTYLKKYLMSNN